ncbi:IS4 family transposase [Sulfobacillus thermosulfidooxidans]|uniref:IS4 family transposase n=1 Tax=Sulfobacillus thermosulfidooxidans TaxID=28034 RepID=UPI0006B5599B
MIPQNHPESTLSQFLSTIGFARILHAAGIHKAAVGIAPRIVVPCLLGLIFTQRNFWRWLETRQSDAVPFGKDVIYRFLNDPRWNWRRVLSHVAREVYRHVRPLSQHVAVFALDDSLYDRSRSQGVELMGPLFDHAAQRMRRGFRWLVLVWTDGQTIIPSDFALLTTQKVDQRQPAHAGIPSRSPGAARRREALLPAPTVAVGLIQQALKNGLHAAYVVCDRWFTTPTLIRRIVDETGCEVIGMLKNSSLRYVWQGRLLTLSQIYRALRRSWSRHELQGSVVVHLPTPGGLLPVKLVFIRDRRGHSREWLALLCTEIRLPDDEIVRLYGKRWDIETFFKVSKSLLGLAREFQSRSYDALIAHTTLVCWRYLFLTEETRTEQDLRSIGSLFFVMVDELVDLTWAIVWDQIMAAFEAALRDTLDLTPDQVEALYQAFLQRLPAPLRDRIDGLQKSSSDQKARKAA